MPGINVAPAPSITVAPEADDAGNERTLPDVRVTRAMRLPCTSTSPANGCSPLPSKMRTLVNNVLAIFSPTF